MLCSPTPSCGRVKLGSFKFKFKFKFSQSCNDGLKNVQKSVMHVQSCSFTNINLSLFCRSRCRRRRCCLSSLLLSSEKWATMVTCRHSSNLYCKLFQLRFTDFGAQIVQINEHKGKPALFALNTICLPLSLSWSSTIQLFRSFSIFSFSLQHHHQISIVFPPDHHIKGNRYTLSMQQLQVSFGRTSVTFDWLIVALNTIDQS